MLDTLPYELVLALLKTATNVSDEISISLSTLISLSSITNTFWNVYLLNRLSLLRPVLQPLVDNESLYSGALELAQFDFEHIQSSDSAKFEFDPASKEGIQILLANHIRMSRYARYCYTRIAYKNRPMTAQMHASCTTSQWASDAEFQFFLTRHEPAVEQWLRILYYLSTYVYDLSKFDTKRANYVILGFLKDIFSHTRLPEEVEMDKERYKDWRNSPEFRRMASMQGNLEYKPFVSPGRDMMFARWVTNGKGTWRFAMEYLGAACRDWTKWEVHPGDDVESVKENKELFWEWLGSEEILARRRKVLDEWERRQAVDNSAEE